MPLRAALIASSVLVFASCAAKAPTVGASTCVLTPSEREWVAGTHVAWELVLRESLKARPVSRHPEVVLFNETCQFTAVGDLPLRGSRHGGAVTLPDGQRVPPQVTSFSSPVPKTDLAFVAMALPSIWATAGVTSELGLTTLMTAVLVHEMTHTLMFDAFNPRLAAVSARYGFGDDLSDDMVQETFEKDPAFVGAYRAERDLLYRAVTEPSADEARRVAQMALASITERRARFYQGTEAKFAEVEDLWLTMEGAAQWAGYAWLVGRNGANRSAERALPLFRRGGRQWSQDEGLAIFLVVDRLLPGWHERVFTAAPATALDLLSLAVNRLSDR